jgi:hypothetical protein
MADSNFVGGTAATAVSVSTATTAVSVSTAATAVSVSTAATAASATYFIVLQLCNLGKTCSLL